MNDSQAHFAFITHHFCNVSAETSGGDTRLSDHMGWFCPASLRIRCNFPATPCVAWWCRSDVWRGPDTRLVAVPGPLVFSQLPIAAPTCLGWISGSGTLSVMARFRFEYAESPLKLYLVWQFWLLWMKYWIVRKCLGRLKGAPPAWCSCHIDIYYRVIVLFKNYN